MITIINVVNIKELVIHKGEQPSVEIKCANEYQEEEVADKKDKKLEKEPKNFSIKILFSGDMERQLIAGKILAVKSRIKN